MKAKAKRLPVSGNQIARHELPDGKIISTVRLEDAFRFASNDRSYETMVFPSDTDFMELECTRTTRLTSAKAAHRDTVKRWLAKGEV